MKYWTPQNHTLPVPVSLVRKAAWVKNKPNSRHADAACWYRTEEGEIYPYVFTRDTAGTWYEAVSELWDLTHGRDQALDGFFGLLSRILEFVEQGVFPPDEACAETEKELARLLEELR